MIGSFGRGRSGATTGRAVWLRAAVAVAVFSSIAAAHPSWADVIEIGQDGAVTRLAKPAVYTSEGVRPIIASPTIKVAAAPLADIAVAINQAAERQALNADLVRAVAWQESRFRQGAQSSKGAVGVMQIMPATAVSLGIDRFDLRQNIEGGAAYLRRMLDRYDGKIPLALAAYNAGPAAVDRFGGVPPFRETQAYVGSILSRLSLGSAVYRPMPLLIEP